MLPLKDPERCTGCSACVASCPVDALKMRDDRLGFPYPERDDGLCTACGKCERACPILGASFTPETANAPKAYAAWAKNDLRKNSSSGGLFSIFADSVLRDGGVVYGAAFDSENRLRHVAAEAHNDLHLLLTSKYLQSRMCDLKEIRSNLAMGRKVLFSGTPCQVAGLYGHLGTDHEKLLTLDIVCHGVPSPGVFELHLGEVARGKVRHINFRDKTSGWKKYSLRIDCDGGSYCVSHRKDPFMRGFLENLYLRTSCHICPFSAIPRLADITLGDFWGVRGLGEKLDDDGGTSLVLVNTEKGAAAFAERREELPLCRPAPLKAAIRGNTCLMAPVIIHPNKKRFLSRLAESPSIGNLILECLGKPDVGILNFQYSEENYGAVLQAYALARSIEALGHRPIHINYVPPNYPVRPISVFEEFRRTYLPRTEQCSDMRGLREQNMRFSRVVAGGDQIWRDGGDYVYALPWTWGKKTLISYAASFGNDCLDWKRREKNALRGYLKRFDYISVREDSGVKICAGDLSVKSEQVLDSVLLLKADDYQEIIDGDAATAPQEDYLAYMILDDADYDLLRRTSVMADLKRRYRTIDVRLDEYGAYRSFGEWLALVKNAKYFVSTSFHGCALAIVFRKQFVAITTASRGNARIFSLFKTFGISTARIHASLASVTENSFRDELNYDDIHGKLAKGKKKSLAFLRNALRHRPSYKKPVWRESSIGALLDWLPQRRDTNAAVKYIASFFNKGK